MKRFETCPRCEGEGWGMQDMPKCLCCRGFGIVSLSEMIVFLETQNEPELEID